MVPKEIIQTVNPGVQGREGEGGTHWESLSREAALAVNSEGEWGLSRQREGEGITGSSQRMSHVWGEREGPGQAAGRSCGVRCERLSGAHCPPDEAS